MTAPIHNDIVQSFCKDYVNGLTMLQLAKKHNVGLSTVKRYLHLNKIPVRKPSEYTRRYFCNEHFFDIIDSESKAYWLGMLTADGCILTPNDGGQNLVDFTLKASDIHHVESFRDDLSSTYPVHTYAYGKSNSAKVIMRSDKLCNGLAQWGVVPRKTGVIFLPQLRPNLMSHYIRGYFDGDGGAWFNKSPHNITIAFYSTSQCFLYDLRLYLSSACHSPKNTLSMKPTGVYCLHYNGRIANLVTCYMYSKATIYLPRKWTIARNGMGTNQGNPQEVVPRYIYAKLCNTLRRGFLEKAICSKYQSGMSQAELVRIFPFSRGGIKYILKRRNAF